MMTGRAFPPQDPEKLRVVILSDAVPSRNGVGTYYDDLAHHLEGRVEAVSLLAPPANGTGDFRGIAIPMPGDPTQKLYFPSPFWLGRKIRDLQPDVIVSATPGGYGFTGLAIAALLRTAFCVGYHTEYSELAGLYWRQPFGKLYTLLLALWDQQMFRFGSVVLATNQALRDAALEGGAKEARIMGTPTQIAFLQEPLRPFPTEIRTVTFAGRLAPEKEVVQVLEAAASHPSLRFRVAGDGPLRETVERRAATLPNLEYAGWVPRERVLALLDETDLLVLPSRFETFGTVAFEAMIRGRLALVSPHCGITHWPNLSPGLLIMEEGESLSKALGRLIGLTSAERESVARQAFQRSRALSEGTVNDWVDVLQRAVAARRTP
jgi:glycosyltransferase involved in cell wall biosynthesis